MKVERLATDGLIPYVRNAKKHDDAQVAQIAASIREFGFNNPVLIDQDNGIIAGHGRVLAARKLGLAEVPCIRLGHLTDTKRRAYIIADNRLTETGGGWDTELLALELEDLRLDDFDLDLTGFEAAALEEILGDGMGDAGSDLPEDTEPEIDRADELRQKWGVETGQLWQLGEHRLLCGDSTKAEDVGRLMAGEKADIVHADPPYGMNLDTAFSKRPLTDKTRKKHPVQRDYEKVIGDDQPFDPTACFDNFSSTKEQFWWGADYYRSKLPDGGSWLVWDKRHGIENVEYTNSEFELCWSALPHARKIIRCVWFGLCGTETQDTKKRIHPNQKPIQVIEQIITWHSKENSIVVDPFSGSGTTIIACENLKRRCRAIEISPAYCAVAMERWHQHAGQTPVLMA